jgi:hypothetical protein
MILCATTSLAVLSRNRLLMAVGLLGRSGTPPFCGLLRRSGTLPHYGLLCRLGRVLAALLAQFLLGQLLHNLHRISDHPGLLIGKRHRVRAL